MRKIIQSLMLASAVVFTALFTISCDTLNALENLGNNDLFNPSTLENTPDYVISVHRVIRYPRGESDLEKELPTLTGGKVYINVNSEIHSRNLTKIVAVPRKDNPETFDLMVSLDRRGKMLWGNLSIAYRGETLAIVIDGILYRQFKPRLLGEDAETVLIDGPFDRNTAMTVAKNSEKNYKIFNPK